MTEPHKKLTAAQTAEIALQRAEEALAKNAEMHQLIQDMHQALMKPQPGYEKALIDRVTEVVLEVEAGKIVGEKVTRYAKVLGAVVAIATALGLVTLSEGRQ